MEQGKNDGPEISIEEAYIRVYGSLEKLKRPQVFNLDRPELNGDTLRLGQSLDDDKKLPKHHEPDLGDSTNPPPCPEVQLPSEKTPGSKSQVTLNNRTEIDRENSNNGRPSTAPESISASSKSLKKVKVLSRTVTRILVPRKNSNAKPSDTIPSNTESLPESKEISETITEGQGVPQNSPPDTAFNLNSIPEHNDYVFQQAQKTIPFNFYPDSMLPQSKFTAVQNFQQQSTLHASNVSPEPGGESAEFKEYQEKFLQKWPALDPNSDNQEEISSAVPITCEAVQKTTPNLAPVSKKSVAFKEKLIEDPPEPLSDPTVSMGKVDLSPKGVLKDKTTSYSSILDTSSAIVDQAPIPSSKKKINSRIPIPISRTIASAPPIPEPLPILKSPAPKPRSVKARKVKPRSATPIPKPKSYGNRMAKKMAKTKVSTPKNNPNKNSLSQVISVPSEENTDISPEDSIEFCKVIGSTDLTASSETFDTRMKGVLQESSPALYSSDTSISSSTQKEQVERESSTTTIFKSGNKKLIPEIGLGSADAQQQHTDETDTEQNSDISKNNEQTKAGSLLSNESLHIVSAGTVPCRYSTAGCEEVLPKGTLAEEEHYEQCRYRPIPCLCSKTCSEIVPYHNFIFHHNTHLLNPIYTSTLSTYVVIAEEVFHKEESWYPKWLCTYDNHFFLMLSRTPGGSAGTGTYWTCWVWMLGTPDEAQKYSYTVKIYKGGRCIQGKFTVQSVRTSTEEIAKTNGGLVFTDTAAKKLAVMTKGIIVADFIIDVTISKKEETLCIEEIEIP